MRTLKQGIEAKFDTSTNSLRVADDYWELVLFLNNFLYEARATLDLLAIVLHNLYNKDLPRSFNDIKENGKHAKIFSEDLSFHSSLVSAKAAPWMKYLLSNEGKTSLRDRAAHYTIARVSICPGELESGMVFRITADMRGGSSMSGNTGLELIGTLTTVRNGIGVLLNEFRKNYTQHRIRNLLNIPAEAPGMFE